MRIARSVSLPCMLLAVACAPSAPTQSAGPSLAVDSIAAAGDSIAARRDSLAEAVLASIAGREQMPAESVFKNLKRMNRIPAARLIRVMNTGFSRSLGVSCDHCHVVGEWEKEDRHQKQVAREMMAMVGTINRDLLGKIQGLESDNPTVNCTTCHRGMTKPALDL